MLFVFKKKTETPIQVDILPSEDEGHDMEPSFMYEGIRYWIKDFTRAHRNPWIGTKFPEYIDAISPMIAIQWHDDYTVDVYEF